MRLAVVCFTGGGAALGTRLMESLCACGHSCEAFTTPRQSSKSNLKSYGESLSQWVAEWFCREKTDGLIFVGACGIAVRAVAPFLRGKTVDPAVVVVDELGQFAVSLLSGHIGSANQLAGLVAAQIGAVPVISTATDLHGRFAVDRWASQRGWKLSSMALAKEVSARLLDGQPVGFLADVPPVQALPEGLSPDPALDLGIWVSPRTAPAPFVVALHIVPNVLCVGIGCRKGVTEQAVEQAVEQALSDAALDVGAVKTLASIDLKKEEPGLCEFAANHALPLRFFSAQELRKADGLFTSSAFVEERVGVDNVCERAAVLGCGNGRLMLKKQACNGVTVAVAIEDWRVTFETTDDGG